MDAATANPYRGLLPKLAGPGAAAGGPRAWGIICRFAAAANAAFRMRATPLLNVEYEFP
jgi:hypothetical protein